MWLCSPSLPGQTLTYNHSARKGLVTPPQPQIRSFSNFSFLKLTVLKLVRLPAGISSTVTYSMIYNDEKISIVLKM